MEGETETERERGEQKKRKRLRDSRLVKMARNQSQADSCPATESQRLGTAAAV